ncbi:hypothetical protein PC129_g10238 [Phytophthora cactorum]|uniref:Uncharacterized protein n=3 Tax=Phytophthora cactorum TaxID=29920 RepID=A0A8T1I3E8_9STRA|nr:hypothetical protein PC111_g20628 [Phytophthora cactorum]KAG2799009.1 hypothetical protein PC112_g21099 [Phytophthora cactorum]KAG3218979.1 hypothetical protein PC129_g10238 [Phytophthora cactorum]
MDQNVTEAAFLEEVSAFLNATDFSETNVGSERTARHAEAGINPSDTESSQEARDRISNDNQVSQHLTRRQTEVLRKRASRLEKLRRGSTTSQRYTLMNSSATGSTWRALAISRREQRYQAEGEKLRLEAAIDEQATYIAILRELLPKNVYDWVALNAVTRLVIISSRQANMQANHILFAEHLRQVFAAYTQLDAVFCGIDGLNGITSSLYSPKTDSTVESFRHFNNYTLPFSFKQTSEAWWQITNLNQWIKEGDGYAKLADPNDTVIMRLRLVRTLPTGMALSVIQRYILRRVGTHAGGYGERYDSAFSVCSPSSYAG